MESLPGYDNWKLREPAEYREDGPDYDLGEPEIAEPGAPVTLPSCTGCSHEAHCHVGSICIGGASCACRRSSIEVATGRAPTATVEDDCPF